MKDIVMIDNQITFAVVSAWGPFGLSTSNGSQPASNPAIPVKIAK